MLGKKVLAGTAIAVATLMSGQAMAELSGNVAASSNYLWRGQTQTAGNAAVSGGIDYSHGSGVYAGIWASNIEADTEIDLYAGFGGEVSGIGYDLGYITYAYPMGNEASEIYVGASYSMFAATYYYDSDNSASYLDTSIEYAVKDDLTLAAHFGKATPDVGDSVADYNISLTKAVDGWDWTMMISDTDLAADPANQNSELQVVMSIAKAFDL